MSVLLTRKLPRLAPRVQALTQNIINIQLLLVLVYLCSSTNFPFWDKEFAAADTTIGFDWVRWHDRIASSQVVRDALGWIYVIVYFGQMAFAQLVLPLVSPRRNSEFVVGLAIILGTSCLISMLMPAIGPNFYFGRTDPVLHEGIVQFYHSYIALRSGTTNVLNYTQLNAGLMVFPSFHAASVVLCCYVFRGTGRVFAIPLACSALMLVTIPYAGGHYLVDLFAGLCVAAGGVMIVRALSRATIKTSVAGLTPIKA